MDEQNTTEPNTMKLKKKLNKPALFLGITTLLCAGVATFFGIQYFTKTPAEQIEDEDISETPEKVVETITVNTMAEDYKKVRETVIALTSGEEGLNSFIEAGSNLTYKPEGFNSYMPTKFTLRKTVDNSLQGKFEQNGFKSLGVIPFVGSAGPQIQGYQKDDIICGIYEGEYNFILNCAKTDWTWLTDEDKALARELETAYYNKTGKYPNVLDVSERSITDSTYEPYQTMRVSLSAAMGLYYRTSKDAKWEYFTAMQGVPQCSEFNAEDLKKAFIGYSCYNGQTESTVQL